MEAKPKLAMVEHALELVSKGFHVIPLNGKVPLTKSGSKDATTREEQVRMWWEWWPDANIGICTGYDDLVVIDIDGPEGKASLGKLREAYGPLPPTIAVKTGGGGGHFYYTVPGGARNSQARKNGWAKIDIRGTGGYVVAPPSVHPETGTLYEWVGGLVKEPAVLEGPWFEALTTRAPARVTDTGSSSQGGHVIEGERNQVLASLAGTMRDKGLDYDAINAALQTHNEKRCSPPLDASEVSAIARSISRYEPLNDPIEIKQTIEEAKTVADTLAESMEKDITSGLQPEMIAALSVIRDDPLEWSKALVVLRKSGLTREAEKAIKRHRAEIARARLESLKTGPLDDEPISLQIPDNFECNASGVWAITGKDSDSLERILHNPLYITARLRDVDSGLERLSLSWKRDGEWHSTNCDVSVAASPQKIVSLADHGLLVDGQNAGQVVRYLTALAGQNEDRIPIIIRSERTGWFGSSRFWPGAADDVEFDPRDLSLKNVISEHGTLEEWVDIVKPLRYEYPLLRLQLSASFSGPLLERVGARGYVVHIWGKSGGGKTSSMNVAASVWGSRKFMKSFMTTRYALTVNAAERTGLPLCINEKQLWAGGFRDPIDRCLYELVEGVSKGQGAKDGGTRMQLRWTCPILTNGETPIINHDSEQGTQSRTIEVVGEPIDDEALASSLYDRIADQYGTAGPEFVRQIIDIKPEQMRADLDKIKAHLNAAVTGKIMAHMATLSIITLADYYSGKYIFGETEEEALLYSCGWAVELAINEIAGVDEIDQAAAAYEDFCNLVRSRIGANFCPKNQRQTSNEWWGFVQDDKVWILTTVFRREMETGKRSAKELLRSFDSKDLVRKEKNGKKVRYSIKGADSARYYVIDFKVDDFGGDSPSWMD